MKFKRKNLFIVLLAILMCVIAVLIIPFNKATAHAAVPDEHYVVDGIDYSGQGTKIDGTLVREPARINGDKVDVSVYKAAYQPSSGWDWSWSGWSTGNNRTNDYETYRGDTATEYQVESRKEYRYKRTETVDTYRTKYYTTYQGAKWYNCWIFLFTSKWDEYEGERNGYKIVNRYTKSEKYGTRQVTKYDSTWKTSAPFSYAWEDSWNPYDERTTYRYRAREMKWSETAQKTTEQVPLNYSLYDKDGNTFGHGIKWQINWDITNELDRDWFSKYLLQADLKFERGYNLTQYFLPQSDYVQMIAKIATNKGVDWFRVLMAAGLGSALGALIGGVCGAVTSTVLVPLFDALLQEVKNQDVNAFKNVLLEYVSGREGVIIITDSYCITDPICRFTNAYFDENNKGYVSMLFDSEKAEALNMDTIYASYSDKINYLGNISYIHDEEVLEVVKRYVNSWF